MLNYILNICKKNKVYPTHYLIKCNYNGYIIDINEATLILLLYEKHNIINKFIGILMSPFMNYLHKNILLPNYLKMNNIEKNIIHLFLDGLSNKRPLIIYNILNEPIYILLSVKFTKTDFDIIFTVINDIDNANIYTKYINSNNNSSDFKLTKKKLVIIAIDFINSTSLLLNEGVLNYIDINKNFHNDIIYIIKKYYYPYIYIYEIIGDAFIIILNAEWNFNITRYTTSLALSFISELIKLTTKYINIRCGITYDNIYYGYIDHNLRLFGKSIIIATRLEALCNDNINCDTNFLNKLFDEKIFTKNNIIVTNKNDNLKGFGNVNYHTINILSIYDNYNFIINYK